MPCRSPHLDETTTAAPGISPGTVTDEEWLLREILNPDHVKDGELQPSAIPLKDLQERGFSIHRLQYVTSKLIEDAINKKLARTSEGKTRVLEGVACFTARSVRDINDDGNKTFVVIDTAKPFNKGHGSIYLFNIEMKGSKARSMRGKLLPLLEKRVSVSEVFAGK